MTAFSRLDLHAALQKLVEAEGGDASRLWVRRGRGRARSDQVNGMSHWDYVSNAALLLAGRPTSPQETLSRLLPLVKSQFAGEVEEANGFLNFRLDEAQLDERIAQAVSEGHRYGAGDALKGEKINVEFVSADPAGPLSFASGRLAASGEALCRLLEWQGALVTREYFLNDAEDSPKMRLLGQSVAAWYEKALGANSLPEGVLREAWVKNLADDIARRDGDVYCSMPRDERERAFERRAREAAIGAQKETLARFGIRFDVWSSEANLVAEGRVHAALGKLRASGHVEEREGALWLKTTRFGDAADRPLLRRGRPTYLATDIAYHDWKFERGFDRLINIWTLEHEPYVSRTRASLQAVGHDPDRVEMLLCAGAQALRDGTRLSRGRGGGAFTLDEAMEEVEPDRLHFHLLRHAWREEARVDLESAARDDDSNPAYEARLAVQRLATLLGDTSAAPDDEAPPRSEAAHELMRLVAVWPDEAATAARERAPERVAHFAGEIAGSVRRLLLEAPSVSSSDHSILVAARHTLLAALHLLGVEGDARF